MGYDRGNSTIKSAASALYNVLDSRDTYTERIPYHCERGPMGSAPYIGLRLGGGLTSVISLSYFTVKEHPGNIHHHKLLTSVSVLSLLGGPSFWTDGMV